MWDGCSEALGIRRLQNLVLGSPRHQRRLLDLTNLLAQAVPLGLDESHVGICPPCTQQARHLHPGRAGPDPGKACHRAQLERKQGHGCLCVSKATWHERVQPANQHGILRGKRCIVEGLLVGSPP